MATLHAVLLSDAHLSDPGEPNQASLVDFLDAVDAEEIVLVGDVADVWWGWRSTVYAAYVPVLGALWRRCRTGTKVTWIRGNHDFHLDALTRLGVVVADRWQRTVADVRYLATHGDGADARFRSIVLNRLLRGTAGRVAARLAGPDWTWATIRGFSRLSRHHKGNWRAVLEAQMRWADTELGTSADVVLVGHTHAPGVAERARGRFVNLGDWVDHRSYATIGDDGVRVWQRLAGRDEPISGPPARRVP